MADKLATAFRLHMDTVQRLDQLVDSPPAWLESCAPGPVENRTEVIERLVFLAVKHATFGLPSDAHPGTKEAKRSATRRPQKGKARQKA